MNYIVQLTGFGAYSSTCTEYPGIILCMRPAYERRRYNITSSLIGWAHTQNDPWYLTRKTKYADTSVKLVFFFRL